jgi:NAD(P)-dependent dehydrogenase (short-subunit alcohol dehydrogenase family)
MRDLNGRVALLTGASTGLGPFIARRLHRER